MKKIKLFTSWDDYSEHNYKLAELLKKYEMPAIFFIELQPRDASMEEAHEMIKRLSEAFEIGSHTITHPMDLKLLEWNRLTYEIRDSKIEIENLIDKEIKWFCYPRGRYNEVTISALNMSGYKYGRTTIVGAINTQTKLMRTDTTVHCFKRSEYGKKNWLNVAKEALLNPKADYFHLWGHAWEIERDDRWGELEELLAFIRNDKRVSKRIA